MTVFSIVILYNSFSQQMYDFSIKKQISFYIFPFFLFKY
ncbi:hypothetical protein HMPREF1319_1166 [Capnocytophaga ochracea str. Holt 25]|nr:hypothetical protein HMPREF1319_1166 [Capnocytophaga ochracea str. Holt 25]